VELNFKCGHCNKKFKTKLTLSQHIERHSTLRPFQCGQCNKKFKTKPDISSHMLVHSDVRPFSCDKCDGSFKSKSELKMHGLVHSNARSFKCMCSVKFKRKGDLVSHMKVVHSNITFNQM
jgi:uncharacterized Zn-finger protein